METGPQAQIWALSLTSETALGKLQKPSRHKMHNMLLLSKGMIIAPLQVLRIKLMQSKNSINVGSLSLLALLSSASPSQL